MATSNPISLSTSQPRIYRIFCVVEGETTPFSLKLPCDDTVDELRQAIKARGMPTFANVLSEELHLYRIDHSAPLSSGITADPQTLLDPHTELAEIYPDDPPKMTTHILVQGPAQRSLKRRASAIEETVTQKWRRIFEPSGISPSALARHGPQGHNRLDEKNYGFNRPLLEMKIPLALLCEAFGKFADDMQTYEPSADDKALVDELRTVMSKKYDLETELCEEFRRVLVKHYPKIQLEAGAIGSTSYQSHGHLRVKDFAVTVAEGNLLGNATGDAEIQARDYYREFMRALLPRYNDLPGIFPCILIYFNGPFLGFSGCVVTDVLHLEALTQVYALHRCPHQSEIATQTARAFGAYSRIVERLRDYYLKLDLTKLDKREVEKAVFPYRDYYMRDEVKVNFQYISRPMNTKLLFEVSTDRGDNLLVKFTEDYSEDAHRYCSNNGIAPVLHAVEELSGGWKMVVMDLLDDPYDIVKLPLPEGLFESLQRAVGTLHKGGFVHGDIRSCNFLFYKDQEEFKVMILDFDWAGVIGAAKYPDNINTVSVERPDGVGPGLPIIAKHDLEMIDLIVKPKKTHW